jgi:uncharacterized membrane protein
MEPATLKLLGSLYVYGPLGVLAILGFLLYFLQVKKTDEARKKNEELSEKLYEVALAAIQSDVEHSKAYEPLEKFFDAVLKAVVERKP